MTKYVHTFILVGLLLITACSPHLLKEVQLPKPAKSTYAYAQVEPSIAIHPRDTNIMVAGSVLNDYYFSKDAGKSWSSYSIQSPYGVYGDPVLIFDTTGRIHYFHLANVRKSSRLDRIVCQSMDSVDGTFSSGTFPSPNGTKVQDKHWVCVNPTNNDMYMTWTQFDAYQSKDPADSSIIVFSKSTDQGLTWSEPMRISTWAGDCLDDDNTVEGAFPAVGPGGQIYVVWTGPKGLVFQESLDGGLTWLAEEKSIAKQVGGWTLDIPGIQRANGLPILKSDTKSGKLYLNWCDQRNGEDNTDIFLAISDDGGVSWGEPVKVNQDKGDAHQFFTWMTVDPSTGYLYFVYYDRRKLKGIETNVYSACSKDQGKTFSEIRVTEKPFTPNPKVFFGDYLNIASLNGCVRAIYPRMDNNKITLFLGLLREEMFK
jgi:hypothetical protein